MSFFEISKFSLKRGGLIEGGGLISDRRYSLAKEVWRLNLEDRI